MARFDFLLYSTVSLLSAQRISRFLRMLGTVLAPTLVLCVGSLKAQISDATQNLPPFGSFAGGDLDVVSLQNGNLHVSIPVLTVKERGRNFTYKFTFDTPIATGTWITLQKPNISHYTYTTLGVGSASAASSPESPFLYRLTDYLAGHDSCAGYYYWSVIGPDGSTHPLDIVTHTPGNNCTGNIPAGPTKDGSGMWVDTSQNPAIVRLKDGTTIVPQQSLEDANGNMASLSSDMLNRNPLTVSSAANTTYTSPSGYTVTGPQYTLWEYTDSNGLQQQFRFDYEAVDQYYLQADAIPNPPVYFQKAYLAAAKLTLPTGATYQFSYVQQSMGELQQITLPTGGTISYSYNLTPGSGAISCWKPAYVSTNPNPSLTCRAVVESRTVTVNGVPSTWTYSNIAPGGYGGTAVITDPAGNDEAHTFQCLVQTQGFVSTAMETQVQKYSGCSPANPNCTTSGTLLRTVATSYAYDSTPSYFGGLADMRPIQVTTTLDNGLVSQTQTDYETFTDPAGETASRLNPTAFREYDYGSGSPGPLLRQTKYLYGLNSNSAYTNLNIVDRVTLKTVYDGSGSQVAQTTHEYDNYSHANQPMVASGAVQHDANFSTSYTTRGNVTAVSQWRNTDGALLTTTNQYDDAGNVLSSIDPLSNKTSFSFADSWSNSTCAPSGQGKAYVTTVTNALGQITSATYDSCTGALGSTTDPNLQKTASSYDLMSRLTQVSYPDGGSTAYCYSDAGGASCTQSGPPYQVVTTKAINSSLNEVSTTVYDGLGRISQTQLNSDPSGVAYTQITYDAIGRKHQVYNPTRCSPPTTNCGTETTWGYTTYNYDPLDRTISVVEPDNSTVSTGYSGNQTTVTDEAGNQRTSRVDGLGRLTGVWEAPNTTGYNYETDYTYDALNNLLSVNQKGGSTNSANWRTRTFTYDSLSRLFCAANPEIQAVTCPASAAGPFPFGTVTYSYDTDGNLVRKTAPSPNQPLTGTATVVTTYTYDTLNRLAGKSYQDNYNNNPPTAGALYGYDGVAISNCTTTPPSLADTYPVGRRTAMCDGSGATSWKHDQMGRILKEGRTIGAVSGDYVNDAYNLNGSPKTITTLGYNVTYGYNGAARPVSVTNSSTNFVTAATYAPPGELTAMTMTCPIFCTSRFESLHHSQRLWAKVDSRAVSQRCRWPVAE